MAKMGRPKKEIDVENFEKLCGLHCTLSDIAGWFNCSEDTIYRFCKEQYDSTFAEAQRKHAAPAKVSLRRAMYEKAMGGNVTMMIWLSKQYLGMTDKVESVVESTENKKLVINFSGSNGV